ncbi:hypothetical protein G6F22_018338 [Rhizopus arrhizus]|nr:hypothetical protein G6F22_018338 [Rhizopus arrhizus]
MRRHPGGRETGQHADGDRGDHAGRAGGGKPGCVRAKHAGRTRGAAVLPGVAGAGFRGDRAGQGHAGLSRAGAPGLYRPGQRAQCAHVLFGAPRQVRDADRRAGVMPRRVPPTGGPAGAGTAPGNGCPSPGRRARSSRTHKRAR